MSPHLVSTISMPYSHSHNHNDHSHAQKFPLSPSRSSANTHSLKLEQSCSSLHSHSHTESNLDQYADSPLQDSRRNYFSYLPPSPLNSTESKGSANIQEQTNNTPTELSPLRPESSLNTKYYSAHNYKPNEHRENFSHLTYTDDNSKHHDCDNHQHNHKHISQVEPRSKFTNWLLSVASKWPHMHTIISEKDSRRIFYFMSLNFSFMLVQAFYGYLTDSLGLLSDSIHMFFDCLALGVGLFAAVASKWPPSHMFPFGFAKIESLSGFGNGVFLILISIEIIFEATERLADGRETKRLGELLIISSLGLAVNLVGIACFGHHGHGGHHHGESGYSHSHASPSPDMENPNDHNVLNQNSNSKTLRHRPTKSDNNLHQHACNKSHSHLGHSHSHDDDNMQGIFLHVLADTMGSAAVIISTLLIYLTGFNGWDPIASCVIAVLIFLSSIPLIKRSANKLLLTLPNEIEYSLRDTLSGVSDLRGVANYYAPRFWVSDNNSCDKGESVLGVMHIMASRGSDLDEVRERTQDFLIARGIDAVVQVEKDGESNCWCGKTSSIRSLSKT